MAAGPFMFLNDEAEKNICAQCRAGDYQHGNCHHDPGRGKQFHCCHRCCDPDHKFKTHTAWCLSALLCPQYVKNPFCLPDFALKNSLVRCSNLNLKISLRAIGCCLHFPLTNLSFKISYFMDPALQNLACGHAQPRS